MMFVFMYSCIQFVILIIVVYFNLILILNRKLYYYIAVLPALELPFSFIIKCCVELKYWRLYYAYYEFKV